PLRPASGWTGLMTAATRAPADRPDRDRTPRPGARSASGAVIGVAGTGKTRLLDAIVAAVEKKGVTVVRLCGPRRVAAGTSLAGIPPLRARGRGPRPPPPPALPPPPPPA